MRNTDEESVLDAGDRDLHAPLPQNSPTVGVYVHGLFLQGAHWNQHGANEPEGSNQKDSVKFGGCLTEEIPRVLFEAVPAIWFEPYDAVKESDSRFSGVSEAAISPYLCPIYKTTTRAGQLSTTGHSTNFVMAINITFRTNEYSASHWVRRGVALICQLDS